MDVNKNDTETMSTYALLPA